MKALSLLIVALFSASCASSQVSAGPGQREAAAGAAIEVRATSKPGQASAVRRQVDRVTVNAIEKATRTLTVADASGATRSMHVGATIARFDEIAVGDAIELEVEQGLLLEYQEPGTPDVAPRAVVDASRNPREKAPGVELGGGVQGTVVILSVDLKTRLVDIRAPGGTSLTVKAGPAIQLEKLKVGDRLLATYLEAVMLSLVKAAK
jgi:hypothetical protein